MVIIVAAHLSEVLTVLLFLETKYYSLEVSLRSCHPRLAGFLFFFKKKGHNPPQGSTSVEKKCLSQEENREKNSVQMSGRTWDKGTSKCCCGWVFLHIILSISVVLKALES